MTDPWYGLCICYYCVIYEESLSSAADWWWRSDVGSGGKAPEKSSAF